MNLKKQLRKYSALRFIRKFVNAPIKELKNHFNLWNFSRKNKYIGYIRPEKYKGRLLVVGFLGDSIETVKFEAFFAKAVQLHKYDCYVMSTKGCWSNRYYRVLGIENFVYFEEYIESIAKDVDTINNVTEDFLSQIRSFDDLMAITFHGVHIGKYICSTLLRQTYTGEINVADPKTRKVINRYLFETITNTFAAEEVFKDVQPDKTMFLERGYSPYGEFFDLSVNMCMDTLQWIGCHKNTAVILKRYNRDNTIYHPSSLSRKSWETLKSLPWNEESGEIVKQELFRTYSSGDWFSEVGTQFNTRIFERKELLKKLELNPDRKVAVIFPHIFWDATFFYGKDLFADYKEWFIETVRAASKNTHLNWIIKIHPANVVKKVRENYQGVWAEVQAIEENLGELPFHIRLLPPDTPINTFSLYSIMDYCLTVRGTVGLEASIFGIPVLTAGTGRYDNYGFTIDSASREEYLSRVSRLHTLPELSREQIELAQKFACGIFVLRPFEFENLRLMHTKDEKATLKVDYAFKSREDFLKAADLKAFGGWATSSTNEDYLDLQKLSWFQAGGERNPLFEKLETYRSQ